jgi:hypothetical protein
MTITPLTGTPWLAVLDRIKKYTDNETTRTLAQMLYDIIDNTRDPHIGEILDAYAYRLLGSLDER